MNLHHHGIHLVVKHSPLSKDTKAIQRFGRNLETMVWNQLKLSCISSNCLTDAGPSCSLADKWTWLRARVWVPRKKLIIIIIIIKGCTETIFSPNLYYILFYLHLKHPNQRLAKKNSFFIIFYNLLLLVEKNSWNILIDQCSRDISINKKFKTEFICF